MSATPFKVEKSDKAYWFDRYYFHCIDCGAVFHRHSCNSRTNPYCGTCKAKYEREKAQKRAKNKETVIRNKTIDEFVKKICEKYTDEENKGNYKQYCASIKQNIADIAEQLKGGSDNGK